jgi:hypothetical protein
MSLTEPTNSPRTGLPRNSVLGEVTAIQKESVSGKAFLFVGQARFLQAAG